MRVGWVALALCGLVVLAGLAFAGYASEPALPPTDPPAPASFDAALVRHGGDFAALGNCAACHTEPGGPALVGGLPLVTPFGTVRSTNITPDPETGIGR